VPGPGPEKGLPRAALRHRVEEDGVLQQEICAPEPLTESGQHPDPYLRFSGDDIEQIVSIQY